jgi:YHS domain-containing protein
MYQVLIKLLLLLGIVWLVRRLVAVLLAPREESKGKGPTAAGNHMVKDPVCGMYMDSRLAVRFEDKGRQLYFCSDECRTTFINEPDRPEDDVMKSTTPEEPGSVK